MDEYIRLDFRKEQLPYIKYHREKEFLGSKIEHKEITDVVEVFNK